MAHSNHWLLTKALKVVAWFWVPNWVLRISKCLTLDHHLSKWSIVVKVCMRLNSKRYSLLILMTTLPAQDQRQRRAKHWACLTDCLPKYILAVLQIALKSRFRHSKTRIQTVVRRLGPSQMYWIAWETQRKLNKKNDKFCRTNNSKFAQEKSHLKKYETVKLSEKMT